MASISGEKDFNHRAHSE